MGSKRKIYKVHIIVKVLVTISLLLGVTPIVNGGGEAYAATSTDTLVSLYQIQTKLTEALLSQQSKVQFKYKGNTNNLRSQLEKAMKAAINSDPYTKYIINNYTYSWQGTTSGATVYVTIKYRESKAQTAYVNKRAKEILNEITTPSMNEHQLVKAIHDWVVLNFEYDKTLKKYTAYEGLTTGSMVCQGYILMTYKLLKEAGIQSVIAEGVAGGEAHAWNMVRLDGKWYHLDTTWDDPVPNIEGKVQYDYYLRTDDQMKKDHKWTLSYPAASTLYRYTLTELIQSDLKLSSFYKDLEEQLGYTLYSPGAVVSTVAELQDKVKQQIDRGNTKATIRYAGTLEQLLEDLPYVYDLDDSIAEVTYIAGAFDDTKDLKVQIEWK